MQNDLAQTPPILPNGAHLYTALIHFHRSSAQISKSHSRQQLFGDRSSSRVNWFGIGAERTSRAYFGGGISTQDVLVKHTLFGYYSLGLSERRSSDWASSLSQGHAERSTRYVRNADGAIVSGSLRWCPVCVKENVEVHGFAAWKVVHQLPFVLECPAHGHALLSDCICCGQPLDTGSTLRLPGEACVRCGSNQFSSHSPPNVVSYSEFIQRCADAIENQDVIYRPAQWAQLMGAVLSHVGSVEKIRQLVEKRLLAAWEVPTVDDIGGSWFDGYRSSFLLQVIQGHLTASPLAVQIMVLQAIEAEIPDIRNQSDSAVVQEQCLHSPSESKNEYARYAQQLGANERVADLVSAPHTLPKVACDLQISPSYARKLMYRVLDAVNGVVANGLNKDEKRRAKLEENWNSRREACRARVRKILHACPETGRTAMWKLCKNSVLWLNKHDREWLDAHVPVRNGSKGETY